MNDDDLVLPLDTTAADEATLSDKQVDTVVDQPKSRSETIAAAYDQVAKQAESKPEGDEQPKPGKLADRERDERGRVLPKKPVAEGTVSQPKPESEVRPQTTVQPAPVPQEKSAQVSPPRAFSIKSKAAWDSKVPTEEQWTSIKQDIETKERNIENGFKMLDGLKPFAERATQSGTTLSAALAAYTGIEDMINRDMVGGLLHIMGNAKLTHHEAMQVTQQLAQRLGLQLSAPTNTNGFGGSPADTNAGADPNALLQLLGPVLSPLQQEIATLKTTLSQRAEADRSQRMRGASSVIETFRSKPEHKYYDNVEETIGDLLESGVVKRTGDPAADLAKAYDIACWQNPEIREHLINERAAKAQEQQQAKTDAARRAAVSIKGAPQGVPVANSSYGSRQAAIAAAYDEVANRL
jgi:hypothetical protein